MRIPLLSIAAVAASLLAGGVLVAKNLEPHAANHILNVSYDPTRELYQDIDPAFIADTARGGGEIVDIRQSHGTLAKSYLEFLFGDTGQEIIAKEGYRAFNLDVAKRHADRLPAVNLFPITLIAKDWNDADQKFFAENGIVDAIYKPKPRTD
jgi:ABC-type sulfate transport system substrate-binding protein